MPLKHSIQVKKLLSTASFNCSWPKYLISNLNQIWSHARWLLPVFVFVPFRRDLVSVGEFLCSAVILFPAYTQFAYLHLLAIA